MVKVCCTTALVDVIFPGLHMYYLSCFANVMKLAKTIFKDTECHIQRFLERARKKDLNLTPRSVLVQASS